MNGTNNAKLSPRRLAAVLKRKFRLLCAAGRGLSAERDYIIGSGVSGRWTIAGGDADTKSRFYALARRAASLLPGTDDEDALVIWLEALSRDSLNFRYGRETFEGDDSEGNKGAGHLGGTIQRVCEASANYCNVLESRALAAEHRAQQQAANEQEALPTQAGAADINGHKDRDSENARYPTGTSLAHPPHITPKSSGRPKDAGQEIDRLREECRLTIEDLAKAIESTPRTVQRHLAGKNRPLPRLVAAYERVFSKALERKVVI